MGCIEINDNCKLPTLRKRLIETWDVLKLSVPSCLVCCLLGLIETWDVLKYFYVIFNITFIVD